MKKYYYIHIRTGKVEKIIPPNGSLDYFVTTGRIRAWRVSRRIKKNRWGDIAGLANRGLK